MRKIKLFCIPHAGGSAFIYSRWKEFLRKDIECIPVELAGRGSRMGEEFYDSLEEAIKDVTHIIENNIGENDYMIYGHSMGAAIAYETCCKLIEDGYKKPLQLFLSGRECPFIEKEKENIYAMKDEDFKKVVLNLGGTPEEIFDKEDLRKVFVPIIRSDYKNIETFVPIHKDTVLPVNMTVLNGKEDNITEEEIEGWKKLCSENFRRFDFEGGHFFLHEDPEKVVKIINESV